MAALMGRGMPRDVYDIVGMINNNVIKDIDLLRKCFIFYNCVGGMSDVLEKKYDIFNKLSDQDLKKYLIPVLPKKEKFKIAEAKEILINYLNKILNFSPTEIKFVEYFRNNKHKPELLFNDVKYMDCISMVS